MGFLRQKPDGSTSLAILTPGSGILPGTKELPISLGALSGKLTEGTAHVQPYKKENKRSWQKPGNLVRFEVCTTCQLFALLDLYNLAKTRSYYPFCSFAPSYDSTFASLNVDEEELLGTIYGDDSRQHAER